MKWPTMTDYQEAIQAPRLCFDDPELRAGAPVVDQLGLPKPISGNFATVYQMNCPGRHRYAVRCFLSYRPDQEQRYRFISEHLRRTRLPFMVDFRYLPKGIKVKGVSYPILKMEWIEADPLNLYIERNLNNPEALFNLVLEFSDIISVMQRCSIAHGDLQHGNILVSNGKIRLIDYDGMYVPGMEGLLSFELGQPNYQHPCRSEEDFGIYLDNFSAWVITASLAALLYHPVLQNRFSATDEHILFRKQDFQNSSNSELFNALGNSTNPTVKTLVSSLETSTHYQDLPQISPLPQMKRKSSGSTTSTAVPSWVNIHERIEKSQNTEALHTWLSVEPQLKKPNAPSKCRNTLQKADSSWICDHKATMEFLALRPVVPPPTTQAERLLKTGLPNGKVEAAVQDPMTTEKWYQETTVQGSGYTAEISRNNPSCVIFLINQSRSMADPFYGDRSGRSKAQGVSDAINKLLQNLSIKCAKPDGLRDYYYVGVLGYGGNSKVTPAFGGELTGKELVPISEVANNPARIEERIKTIDDGAGGMIEQKVKFPIWFDPIADGNAPMCQALTYARSILEPWLTEHPRCFPPIVFNVTDGEATDGDPSIPAQRLTELSSSDGNVLLFNSYISDYRSIPIEYPNSENGLPPYARVLFRMSSPLTGYLCDIAQQAGLRISVGARGFAFNADIASTISYLDIGGVTRASNLR